MTRRSRGIQKRRTGGHIYKRQENIIKQYQGNGATNVNNYEETGATNVNNYEETGNTNEQISYRDILTGRRKNEEIKKVIHIDGEEIENTKTWKKRSVIAESINLEKLKKVGEILPVIFPNTMELRYLGGFFLITFGSQVEAEDFRVSFKESWEELFSDEKEWKGGPEKFERLAWVKIIGIPIMLRNKEVVEKIGKTIGKIVFMERNNMNSRNLNETRMGIIVNNGKEIREEVKLKYREQEFIIWILELSGMWAPEFILGKYLLINPVEENTPENQDTPMNEQNPAVDVTGNGEEEGTGNKEEEGSGSQKVNVDQEKLENEQVREDTPFGDTWEKIFRNKEDLNKVNGINDAKESSYTDRENKKKWVEGPISKGVFKAQNKNKKDNVGARIKGKPVSKEYDILGQVFK
ncbi:hypothetical protein Hanom_Chr09g00791031 [Helianthus anomalus]